jgi:predicted enzyme related to lactoylglutathione lyase
VEAARADPAVHDSVAVGPSVGYVCCVASRIVAVVVDCRDSESLAEFWCAALGYQVTERWRDARGKEYVEVSADGRPMLLFHPVPDGKGVKNRLHLDLRPAEGNQDTEVRRLVALGARVVASEPDFPWVVLVDPEGNEFCVLPPA